MKRKIYSAVAILMAILIVVPMLGTACAKPPEKEPITIGVLVELTGFLSPCGTEIKRGATLAFEMLGPEPEVAGRPLRLIVEDTASDPATCLDKARKLVETDKACLIIGPMLVEEIMAIQDYLKASKVPTILLEMHPEKEALKQEWIWFPTGTLEETTYPLGIYAYDELGYRKVTTLANDFAGGHEFIDGFARSFIERGGEIIQQQWYPGPEVKDFSPYILALKDADALVCFLPGIFSIMFYKAWEALGGKMPVLETPGDLGIPAIKDAVGGSAVGTRMVVVWNHILDTPGNKEFVDAFQEQWGALPSYLASDAYNDIQIALEALKLTGGDTSGDALAKALSGISMEGIQGPLSFTPDNIAIRRYYIWEYVDVNGEYDYKLVKSYMLKPERVGDKVVYNLVK